MERLEKRRGQIDGQLKHIAPILNKIVFARAIRCIK